MEKVTVPIGVNLMDVLGNVKENSDGSGSKANFLEDENGRSNFPERVESSIKGSILDDNFLQGHVGNGVPTITRDETV